MNTQLRFQATFQISEKELVLRYEVENRSARDVYLLDRIDRGDGPYTGSPDVIYVHLDRDARTVWLNKRIAPIPKGRHPTVPIAPFPSPLRAGATVREVVRVPLPVRELREYWSRPPGHELRPTEYREVYFSLQYYWRTEGMTEEVIDFDGVKVVGTGGGRPLTDADFGLLESERVKLRIPVLEGPG